MGQLGQLAHRLYRRVHDRLYWRASYTRDNISLGEGVYIASGSVFGAKETVIGDHTRINGPIRIVGFQRVTIGKYCAFGANITVVSTNHLLHHANLQVELQRRFGFTPLVEDRGPITIGHNVWIGDHAVLLPGVKVGDGAVVGASSVVTRDVPPFSIAAGVPARILKRRFDDSIIRELLAVRWWDWPAEKMAKNRSFFETDLRKVSNGELRSMMVDV